MRLFEKVNQDCDPHQSRGGPEWYRDAPYPPLVKVSSCSLTCLFAARRGQTRPTHFLQGGNGTFKMRPQSSRRGNEADKKLPIFQTKTPPRYLRRLRGACSGLFHP